MFKKVAIDCGHCLSGADTGASGCGYREEMLTRQIGYNLKAKLESKGMEVIMVEMDSSSSLNESLSHRTSTANQNGCDLYISIHLNAYDGSAYGTEVWTAKGCSQTSINVASRVNKEIANGFNWYNRGVKQSNFYVLRNSSMPAILVETCFIDNQGDMNIFDANKVADCICAGVTGSGSSATGNTQSSENSSDNKYEIAKEYISGKCQDVQNKLQSLGYYLGNCGADGIFGQGTFAAIKKFQSDNGLSADGIYGPNTEQVLNNKTIGGNGRVLNKCINNTVSSGSTGTYVFILQSMLDALGYSVNGIDGVCGSGCTNAIKNFQSDNGLSSDGICGPNTWKKLFN